MRRSGVVGEDPVHVHLIEHEADVDSLDFRPEQKLVLLTQTTLSIDETAGTIAALKCRFPWMKEPPSSDICYATSNRQTAVKLVAEQSDSVVIVGSANSSNSVRLMEVAQEAWGSAGERTAWMTRTSSTRHGSTGSRRSASRRAHPCRTNWSRASSRPCAHRASPMYPPWRPSRRTCISCFRRNSAGSIAGAIVRLLASPPLVGRGV